MAGERTLEKKNSERCEKRNFFSETFPPRGVFCTEMASMIVRPRYLPLRISHVQTERDGDRAMFMSITWGLIADIGLFYFYYSMKRFHCKVWKLNMVGLTIPFFVFCEQQ